MYGCDTGIGSRPCGTHAFAERFRGPWTLSGTGAYGPAVEMLGGTRFVTHSRERPHLVLTADGSPTHLVTGTGYDMDAAITLVQPLRAAHGHSVFVPLLIKK